MTLGDTNALIRAAREAIGKGSPETAETIAASILAEHPTNMDALEIKALVALRRGDLTSAESILRAAISVAPKRRWPYADLTRLLMEAGRNAEAEQVARNALAADNQNPDAHALLATLVAQREQWVDAASHFQRAIALVGDHPQLLTGLGHARMRSGRLDEARALLEAAIAADPTALESAVYLAEVEERLGNFAAAERQLDVAEQTARKLGTDVDLQRSVLLARTNRPEQALALLEHRDDLSGAALLQRGRLHDRLDHHDEAWDDWRAGKTRIAERYGRHYQAEEVAKQAKSLVAYASPAGDCSTATLRNDVPQPIFIIGFPRSGTTLIEQILASHSAIVAGGELPFGAELGELRGEKEPDRLRDHYLGRAKTYGLLNTGARYFTDKMPDNSFWLPLLRLAFPESPVIQLRRHPLDVLVSVMAHDMTHGFNCGYRLEDAAGHLALVDDLLRTYSESGVGPTCELRYESLVADLAGEAERVMAAIDLTLEEDQVRYHERAEVSPTPSYAQVREPLNDRSIGRWRNYASKLELVRSVVASAMARGGYES